MKRMSFLALAVALLIGLAATPSVAQEVTASADLMSAYVWRGQTFNDGLVFQPSIDFAAENGLGVNVWGNLDLDDYDDTLDEREFSEVDLTISYSRTIAGIDAEAGFIEYLYPNAAAEGPSELYVSASYGLPANLSVGAALYYEFDEITEYYLSVNVGYAMDLNDQLALEAGASIAFAGDDYCADGGAGLYDYSLTASLGYTINRSWSASVYIGHVGTLDDDNLDKGSNAGTVDVEFYTGVGVSYAF